MIFGDVIKEIVEKVDSCTGGIVMDLDGIMLDSFAEPDSPFDLQLIGIEFSNIIREVKKATQGLEVGDLNELVINAEGATVVLLSLTSEYFLAIVMKNRALLGKVRYLARMAEPKLVAEL